MNMNTIALEKRKKRHRKKVDDKYEKLYLLHHMHHFRDGNKISHELHHCFLFNGKSMQGKRYSVTHKTNEDKLYHCVSECLENKLYDHAGNVYLIIKKKINGKRVSTIKI